VVLVHPAQFLLDDAHQVLKASWVPSGGPRRVGFVRDLRVGSLDQAIQRLRRQQQRRGFKRRRSLGDQESRLLLALINRGVQGMIVCGWSSSTLGESSRRVEELICVQSTNEPKSFKCGRQGQIRECRTRRRNEPWINWPGPDSEMGSRGDRKGSLCSHVVWRELPGIWLLVGSGLGLADH
jgi:hypothetical protein